MASPRENRKRRVCEERGMGVGWILEWSVLLEVLVGGRRSEGSGEGMSNRPGEEGGKSRLAYIQVRNRFVCGPLPIPFLRVLCSTQHKIGLKWADGMARYYGRESVQVRSIPVAQRY